MKHLYDILKKTKKPSVIIPSPYLSKYYEGFIFDDLSVLTTSKTGTVIDTSVYLNQALLSPESERLAFYLETKNILLKRASEEFRLASTAHFELEKIYVGAMDFEKVNKTILSDKRSENFEPSVNAFTHKSGRSPRSKNT